MQFEQLINTSAPRGLGGEAGGYVTVARTENLHEEMSRKLAEASSMESALLDQKALVQRLLIFNVNKVPWVVLTQISSSGLDHTGRSNRIAHHLASPLSLVEEGDPVRIFSTFKFCTKWEGHPRILSPLEIKVPPKKPRSASTWKMLFGDAGSAGVVTKLAFPGKHPLWIESKNLNSLELVSEISSLLPGIASWKLSFSLCASGEDQLPWARCTLRFVSEGREKLIPSGGKVVNLSTITVVDGDPYVESARQGIPFDQFNVRNEHTKKYSEYLEREKKTDVNLKNINEEKSISAERAGLKKEKNVFVEKKESKNKRFAVVFLVLTIVFSGFFIKICFLYIKHHSLLKEERRERQLAHENLTKTQEHLRAYVSVGTLEEVEKHKFNTARLGSKLKQREEQIDLLESKIGEWKLKVKSFEQENSRLQEEFDSRGSPRFLKASSLAEIFVGNKFVRVSYSDLEKGLEIQSPEVNWYLGAKTSEWKKDASEDIGMLTFVNKSNKNQINLDCVNLNNRFYLKIASGKDRWPIYNFKSKNAFFLILQFGNIYFLVEGKQDEPGVIASIEEIRELVDDPEARVALAINSLGSIKKSNPSGVRFLDDEDNEYLLNLEEGSDRLIWKGSVRSGIHDFSKVLNVTINNMISTKDEDVRLTSSQLDYLRNKGLYDEFDDLVKDQFSNKKSSLFPKIGFIARGIPEEMSRVADWTVYKVPIIWNSSLEERLNK